MVIFRVESTSRWDALALASKFGRYRWYLIQPDDRHRDVYVSVEQTSSKLREKLRRTIKTWLHERSLDRTIVHSDTDYYVIAH